MTHNEGEAQNPSQGASTPMVRPVQHVVRRVVPADVATLVEVLARAFDDDPVPQWLFRGDRRRRRGLRTFFTIQLRHMYLERGEVYTTGDLAGAAMWSPPGRQRPGWRDLLRLVPVMPYLTGLGETRPRPLVCSARSTRRAPRTALVLGDPRNRSGPATKRSRFRVAADPCSTTSTWRGSPPIWSHRRRPISPSTTNTGSR